MLTFGRLLPAALLLLPFECARAQVADPPRPSFDMTFGTRVTSDYNYRGYTLSDHLPSVSAYFEATYGPIFAGLEANTVRLAGLPPIQMTYSAGVRPKFGAATFEFGGRYYNDPGSGGVIDYPEFFFRPSYAFTPRLTVGVDLNYAPDYIRSGAWETYFSTNAKYALSDSFNLSGEVGLQQFGPVSAGARSAQGLPTYGYGNIGVAYIHKIATVDLRFHATTLSKQECFLITGSGDATSGSNGCGPAIILSFSLDSSLSTLRDALFRK
jgi:uncharacterized protein (TIGR02001 family)